MKIRRRKQRIMMCRITSVLLVMAMLLQGMPVGWRVAKASAEGKAGDKVHIGLNYQNDSVCLVEDGVAVEKDIPGISYDEDTEVLTLENAKLAGGLWIDSGSPKISLKGSNVIDVTGTDSFGLEIMKGADLEIGGGGDLEIKSDNTNGICDDGNLHITGGCRIDVTVDITRTECWYVAIDGTGDLMVDGGTELNLYGQSGITLSGNITFRTCNVTTNSIVRMEDEGKKTVEIGEGAVVNINQWISPYEYGSGIWVFGGSRFFINGGSLNHIISENEEVSFEPAMFWLNGGTLEMAAGEINYQSPKGRAFRISPGSRFVQTGGSISIKMGNDTQEDTGECGIFTDGGSDFSLQGGSINIEAEENYFEGAVTIAGGQFKAQGWDVPFLVDGGGSLRMLGGELSLVGGKYALYMGEGVLRFMGGKTTLKSSAEPVLNIWGFQPECLTLGAGMHALSDGKEVEIEKAGNTGVYNVPEVTISGEGGSYAADMYVSSGRVVAGASFTVRAAFLLESADGRVSFQLPDGVHYLAGSLTQNGKLLEDAVCYDEEKRTLTIDVKSADCIRFSAYAEKEGTYSIVARAEAGETVHQEKLSVAVSGFTMGLPAQTKSKKIPISGMAVPGSKIVIYDNGVEAGEAEANALGTYKMTVKLQSEQKSHMIYAVVSHGSVKMESEADGLIYDPDLAEVEKLTISNRIHGAAEGEVIDSEVVLNYAEGTRSSNYITYWPEMPQFTFRVDFTDDADVDAVKEVRVVTTDGQGVKQRIPLSRVEGEKYWTGTYCFEEEAVQCPESYQVEWEMGDGQNPDDKKKETEEFDHSDGEMVVGEKGAYTFRVSSDAKFRVVDGAGRKMEYQQTKNNVSVRTDDPNGDVYVVELQSGKFLDYPGTKKLFIVLQGGGGRKGSYQYTENVQEVDKLPENAGSQKEGTVYVVNHAEAYTVVDGKYEESVMEEVYDSLSFSQADLPEQSLDAGMNEAALKKAVMNSKLYSGFCTAAKRTAEKAGVSVREMGKPEITIDYSAEINKKDSGERFLNLSTKIGFEWEKDGLTFSLSFDMETKQKLDIKVDYTNGKLRDSYFIYDGEMSFQIGTGISYSDSDDWEPEGDVDLKRCFEEELGRNLLKEVKQPDENDDEITVADLKVPIPGSVPGLAFVLRLDFLNEFGASGELALQGKVTVPTKGGIMWTNGRWQMPKGSQEPTKWTGAAAFHGALNAGMGLRLHVGVGILNFFSITGYIEGKLEEELGGHVKLAISNPESAEDKEKRMEAECYYSVNLKLSPGVDVLVKLARGVKYELKIPLFQKNFLLYYAGTNVMPRYFAVPGNTEDAPVMFKEDCDLRERIDLKLYYQMFNQGEEYSTGEMVFAHDKYKFELPEPVEGISVSEDGMLSVTGTPEKDTIFDVIVHYYGSDPKNYDLNKTIKMKYVSSYATIRKQICDASKEAVFSVIDLTDGSSLGSVQTDGGGMVDFETVQGHRYQIAEIACASGYKPVVAEQTVEADGTVTFVNIKDPEEEDEPEVYRTLEFNLPKIEDPSGYVYEGIPGNRLSGVTATLYYSKEKPEDGYCAEESQKWDADAFDQNNPQMTDALGQYLWMVPNGWWQVKYEKEGYQTIYSQWMPVPPVQTEVNIGLYSQEAAEMEVTELWDGRLRIVFSRPVLASSVNSDNVSITAGGKKVEGGIVNENIDISDDGMLCATSCCFKPKDDLELGTTVKVDVSDVITYAGTKSSCTAEITFSGKGQTELVPEDTSEPEETTRPENSAKPEVTLKPETTSKPETTPKPETTLKPETTPKPEITLKPETTSKPETTPKPETTLKPEITSKPEETPRPENSAKPEETPEQDKNMQPEHTIDPVATSEPYATAVPGNSAGNSGAEKENNTNDKQNGDKLKIGSTFVAGNIRYKVLSVNTVSVTGVFPGAIHKGRLSIRNKVDYQGGTYKITAVADSAVQGNKYLKEVSIGNNVSAIGIEAFRACAKLKKVSLGKNVKTIGKRAFFACSKLRTIRIKSSKLKRVGKKALENISPKAQIRVPAKKRKRYKKIFMGKGQNKTVKVL